MRKKLPQTFQKHEILRLLVAPNTECPTGIRNRAMMVVMYRAGLRSSEVCKLKLEHYRPDDNLLEVRGGKGGKDRIIPIDATLKDALEKWLEVRPESTWLFCTIKRNPGRMLSDRYLRKMVKEYASKTGVDELKSHPHTFRHTYATELINEGFNIHEVQQLMGHESISTTQIYLHTQPKDLLEKVLARG